MITAFIKGQAIETAESVIVAESLNYLKAQFVFVTNDWKGLEKKAYFTQGETTHSIKLDENNIAFPLHLSAGEWAVSVVGREYKNGELVERITTDTATINVRPFKTGTETPFPEPAPTEIEALKAEMGNLPDLATSDKTSLVNAINEVYRRGGSSEGGSGSGITTEQAKQIEENTKARHTHNNKDILDKFGNNTAKTRPTFNNGSTDNVLATQGDILSRVNPLQQTVPNSAVVDGSTLKMQRKSGEAVTDLFSVELPENSGENVDLSNYYTRPEADEIFAKKADIPTDESYEFIGQTPLTLENGGNIKLVAYGEANYSIVSPTVWNFDNAELTLSNVELDTSEGYYKFTVNNEAAKHTYCYAAFIISGLEVGRNYRFVFDTAGRTYDTANRIWTGSLTAYNGTSTAGGVAFTGKVLKNGNFDFTAADTSLYVRYVCAMNTTPYLGWVAHFNKMYLNYADTSEELTEIYSKSGTFTDVETFKSIPSGVVITTDPTASVYRKAPTDKTLTQSDVPADAEITGKEIAEIKNYLPLYGKTIVNFGDSIFAQAQPPNNISTFLANKTGATVYNFGFGGCAMTQRGSNNDPFSMCSLSEAIANNDYTVQENTLADTSKTFPDYFAASIEKMKNTDFSKIDIVTIAYGTNDWNGSVVLDNEENLHDTATIGGALRTSIETLLTAYPNARIFVLSTTWRFWHDDNNVYTEDSDTRTNSIGLKLADYNAKLKEVAEEYNIPFVDDYNIGINKFNRSQYFSTTDGTHHQIEGRKLIAEHLAKELY